MKGARRTRKQRTDSGFADLMSPSSPTHAVPGVITGLGRTSPLATTPSAPPSAPASTRSATSVRSVSSPPPADDWGELLHTLPRRRLSPQKPIIEAPGERRSQPYANASPFRLAAPSKNADVTSVNMPQPPLSKQPARAAFVPAQPTPTNLSAGSVPAFLSGWDGADGWGDDPTLDDSDPDNVDDDAWGAWSDPEIGVEEDTPLAAHEHDVAHDELVQQPPLVEQHPSPQAVPQHLQTPVADDIIMPAQPPPEDAVQTPPVVEETLLPPVMAVAEDTASAPAADARLIETRQQEWETADDEAVGQGMHVEEEPKTDDVVNAWSAWDDAVSPADDDGAQNKEPSQIQPLSDGAVADKFETTAKAADAWGDLEDSGPVAEEAQPVAPPAESEQADDSAFVVVPEAEETEKAVDAWDGLNDSAPAADEEAAHAEAHLVENPTAETKQLDEAVFVTVPESKEAEKAADAWGGWDESTAAAAEDAAPVEAQPDEQPVLEAKPLDESAIAAKAQEVRQAPDAWDDSTPTAAVEETALVETQPVEKPTSEEKALDEGAFLAVPESEEADKATDVWHDWDAGVHATTEETVLLETDPFRQPVAETRPLDESAFGAEPQAVEDAADVWDGSAPAAAENAATVETRQVEKPALETKLLYGENAVVAEPQKAESGAGAWSGWDDSALAASQEVALAETEPEQQPVSETKPFDEIAFVAESQEAEKVADVSGAWDDTPPSAAEKDTSAQTQQGESACTEAQPLDMDGVKEESKRVSDAFGEDPFAPQVQAVSNTADAWGGWDESVSPAAAEAFPITGQLTEQYPDKTDGSVTAEAHTFEESAIASDPRDATTVADVWGGWDHTVPSSAKEQAAPVKAEPVRDVQVETQADPLADSEKAETILGVLSGKDGLAIPVEQQMIPAEARVQLSVPQDTQLFDESIFANESLAEIAVDAWGGWGEVGALPNDQSSVDAFSENAVVTIASDARSLRLDGLSTHAPEPAHGHNNDVAVSDGAVASERLTGGSQAQSDGQELGAGQPRQENEGDSMAEGCLAAQVRDEQSSQGLFVNVSASAPVDSDRPHQASAPEAVQSPPKHILDPSQAGKGLSNEVQQNFVYGQSFRGSSGEEEDGCSADVRSTDVEVSSTVADTDVPSVAAPSSVDDSDWDAVQQTASWEAFSQLSNTEEAGQGSAEAVSTQSSGYRTGQNQVSPFINPPVPPVFGEDAEVRDFSNRTALSVATNHESVAREERIAPSFESEREQPSVDKRRIGTEQNGWASTGEDHVQTSGRQNEGAHSVHPDQALDTVRDEFPSASAVDQIAPSGAGSLDSFNDLLHRQSDGDGSRSQAGQLGNAEDTTLSFAKPGHDEGIVSSHCSPVQERCELNAESTGQPVVSEGIWGAPSSQDNSQATTNGGNILLSAAEPEPSTVITAAPFPSGNANNYWTEKLQSSSQDANRAWAGIERPDDGLLADGQLQVSQAGYRHNSGDTRDLSELTSASMGMGAGENEVKNADGQPLIAQGLGEKDASYDPFAPSGITSDIQAMNTDGSGFFAQGSLSNPTPGEEQWNEGGKSVIDCQGDILNEKAHESLPLDARHEGTGKTRESHLDRGDEQGHVPDAFSEQPGLGQGGHAVFDNGGFDSWTPPEKDSAAQVSASGGTWFPESNHAYDAPRTTEMSETCATSDTTPGAPDSYEDCAVKDFASVTSSAPVASYAPGHPGPFESYDPFVSAQVGASEPPQGQSQFDWAIPQASGEPIDINASLDKQAPSEAGMGVSDKRDQHDAKDTSGNSFAPENSNTFSALGGRVNVGDEAEDLNLAATASRAGDHAPQNETSVETRDDIPASSAQGQSVSVEGLAELSVDNYAPMPQGPGQSGDDDAGFELYAPRPSAPSSVAENDGIQSYALKPSLQSQPYGIASQEHDADSTSANKWDSIPEPQAYAPKVNRDTASSTLSDPHAPYPHQASQGHIGSLGSDQSRSEESSVNIFSATGDMSTNGFAMRQPPQPPQLFQPNDSNTPAEAAFLPPQAPLQEVYDPVQDFHQTSQYAPIPNQAGWSNGASNMSYDNTPVESTSSVTGSYVQMGVQQEQAVFQAANRTSYKPVPPIDGVMSEHREKTASNATLSEFPQIGFQGGKTISDQLQAPSIIPSDPYAPAEEQMGSGTTTLDSNIYSYPFSIMDASASGELDYRPPRPVFSWGFGGTLLTVLPYASSQTQGEGDDSTADAGAVSSTVRLYDLSRVTQDGSNDDWIAASEALPPPTIPVNTQDLLPYAEMCDRLSKCSAGLKGSHAESRAALWRVLALMCRQGTSDWRSAAGTAVSGPSAIPMFERSDSSSFLSGRFVGESPLKVNSAISKRSAAEQCEAAAEVERLVTQGQGPEAIRVAQDAGLWSLALVLAATLDRQLYMNAITEFAKNSLNDGSALQTLFFSMAENDAEIIRKATSVSGLNDWRKSVGMLLTSRRSTMNTDPRKGERFLNLIEQVGDALISQRGDVVAGHVCYLISGRITSLDVQSVALLGADMKRPAGSPQSCGSPAAVLQSLVYEAIVNAQRGETFPYLLPFRLVLAQEIAAVGHADIALRHCESMATALRAIFDSGRTDIAAKVLTPPFLASLESLEQRLRTHLGMKDSKEKLGKLSALGRSLTSVFNRSSGDLKVETAVKSVKDPSTRPDSKQDSPLQPLPFSQQMEYSQPMGYSQPTGYLQPPDNSQTIDRSQSNHFGVGALPQGQGPAQSMPTLWQGSQMHTPQFGAPSAPRSDRGPEVGKKEESGSKRWNEFVSKTIGVLAPADGDLSPPPRSRGGQTFPAQAHGAPSIGLGPGTGSRTPGHELENTHMRSQSMGDVPMDVFNAMDANFTSTAYGQYGSSTTSAGGMSQEAGLRNFNGVAVQEQTSATSDSSIGHQRSASDVTLASQTSEKKPPRPPRRSTAAYASTSALDSAGEKKSSAAKGWRSRFSEKILSAFRGPPRAHMGTENKFVFDKERGKWVMEGEEPVEDDEIPPPPPDDDSMFGNQANEVSATAGYGNLGQVGHDSQPLPRSHSMQDSPSNQPCIQPMDMGRSTSYNPSYSPTMQTASSIGSYNAVPQSTLHNPGINPSASYGGTTENMSIGENGSESSATSSASVPTPFGANRSHTSSPAPPMPMANKFRANAARRSGRRAYVDPFNNRPGSASGMPGARAGRPAAPAIAGLGGGGGVKIFTPSPAPATAVDDSVRNLSVGMGAVSTSSSVYESSEPDVNQYGGTPHSSTSTTSHQPQYTPRSSEGPRMMA